MFIRAHVNQKVPHCHVNQKGHVSPAVRYATYLLGVVCTRSRIGPACYQALACRARQANHMHPNPGPLAIFASISITPEVVKLFALAPQAGPTFWS